MPKKKPQWDASSVRALRHHMALTQNELAEILGVRQQTVSEWETGAYQPRGASGTLLGRVADDAGYTYNAGYAPDSAGSPPTGGALSPKPAKRPRGAPKPRRRA